MKRMKWFFLVAALFALQASAQTKIRFTLDWVFEGQTSFMHMANYKGYFKEEGLEVQVDVGTGSAGAFQRIMSGVYDAGLGDMSSQIEFLSRNPGPLQFQSVYVMYDQIPAAFFALKKSGIKSVKDFPGRVFMESPTGFSRRIWPILAKAADIDPNSVKWVTASPALRATMLINGDCEIISGFLSIPIDLEKRGVKPEDVVTIPVADYRIHYYGNTLLVSQKLIEGNPKAVAGLVRAFNRALKEMIADPATSVKYLKQREPLVDEALEVRRTRMVLPGMLTDNVRANGLGAVNAERLQKQIDQVSEAYGLTNPPTQDKLFNPKFLPSQGERALLTP
jgi:NitT/TauT family transport system substrate-binding protein